MTFQSYYEEIIDNPRLEQRIRSRYAREIQQLESAGFEVAWCVKEIEFPLGMASKILALIAIPIGWLKRELMEVKFPFHALTYHPILFCRRDTTYAYIFGLGIQLYTPFLDGTVLVSANYLAHNDIVSPENQYYRYEQPQASIASCVDTHRQRIRELENDGLQVSDSFGFNDFVRIAKRDMDVKQNPHALARKAAQKKASG